jgi:hypothetical protein
MTTPMATKDTPIIPETQLTEAGKKFSKPAPNTGTLIVKRDGGFYGSACFINVYINEVHVANIDPGEKTILYLPESGYSLGISACSTGKPNEDRQISIVAGKEIVYRIGDSGFAFHQTDLPGLPDPKK